MEKISFTPAGEQEDVEFYVIEETRINGASYILVAESEDDEATALILKEVSGDNAAEVLYEIVEDDIELEAVANVFGELLDDIDIQR
jgi:Protein of unknown function (DUF1292).